MAELKPNPVVRVQSVEIGNRLPLTVVAGPCALESRDARAGDGRGAERR